MNTQKIILQFLFIITSNLLYSQMEFSLDEFGEHITKEQAVSEYNYDDELVDILDTAAPNELYILKETPETRYAFTSNEDYELFKTKNIVGLVIKTSKTKIDEILTNYKNTDNHLIYFKPLGMFGGGMLLIALHSNELEDALRFEGFASRIYNMETKSFDRVSIKKLATILTEWNSKYDTEILSIAYNGLMIKMNTIPDDNSDFVSQLNSICPDAIAQVYMSEERMWKTLEMQKILTLWWD